MVISIKVATEENLAQVYACDTSFTVTCKLRLAANDGVISYTVEKVAPFEKQYPQQAGEYEAYVRDLESDIFLARVDEKVAGRIVLKKWWNGYGYVENIAVNRPFRKQGVGQQLMKQAVAWAKAMNLPGLMLETQNINVPACRFYERFGFKLKGFDTQVYGALMPGTEEVALYWYLIF